MTLDRQITLVAALWLSGCGSDDPDAGLDASRADAGALSVDASLPDAGEVQNPCRIAGYYPCDGVCLDVTSDPQSCGGCGRACGVGEVCSFGVCERGCTGGRVECSGACVDPRSQREHCGACGAPCRVDQVCSNERCRCPASEDECDGTCTDRDRDPMNCGGCGRACEPGQTCEDGSCG